MRSLHLSLAALLTIGTTALLADSAWPGKVKPKRISVKHALKLQDDTPVVLDGTIIKQLDEEHFLFQDRTGKIVVEIDDDLLEKRPLKPHQKVRLFGEVDKELHKTTVEVEHFTTR